MARKKINDKIINSNISINEDATKLMASCLICSEPIGYVVVPQICVCQKCKDAILWTRGFMEGMMVMVREGEHPNDSKTSWKNVEIKIDKEAK